MAHKITALSGSQFQASGFAGGNLTTGLFEDTLPVWISENSAKIAFMHVDCDLYSSTKIIFNLLAERLLPGSVIFFDDYFNFVNWEEDGHRIFMEYLEYSGMSVDCLGYSYKELAVKLTSRS